MTCSVSCSPQGNSWSGVQCMPWTSISDARTELSACFCGLLLPTEASHDDAGQVRKSADTPVDAMEIDNLEDWSSGSAECDDAEHLEVSLETFELMLLSVANEKLTHPDGKVTAEDLKSANLEEHAAIEKADDGDAMIDDVRDGDAEDEDAAIDSEEEPRQVAEEAIYRRLAEEKANEERMKTAREEQMRRSKEKEAAKEAEAEKKAEEDRRERRRQDAEEEIRKRLAEQKANEQRVKKAQEERKRLMKEKAAAEEAKKKDEEDRKRRLASREAFEQRRRQAEEEKRRRSAVRQAAAQRNRQQQEERFQQQQRQAQSHCHHAQQGAAAAAQKSFYSHHHTQQQQRGQCQQGQYHHYAQQHVRHQQSPTTFVGGMPHNTVHPAGPNPFPPLRHNMMHPANKQPIRSQQHHWHQVQGQTQYNAFQQQPQVSPPQYTTTPEMHAPQMNRPVPGAPQPEGHQSTSAKHHQQPIPPTSPSLPTDYKYARMPSQNGDGPQDTTTIKRNILINWALQPPALQALRPIDALVTSIHTIFPPAFGVANHDYFAKWKPITRDSLVGTSASCVSGPDEEKLKKAVRKVRVFLHPDKLPKDMDVVQSFVCKMLWDVTSDAWEECKCESLKS